MKRIVAAMLVILLVLSPVIGHAQIMEKISRMLPTYVKYYDIRDYTFVDVACNRRGWVYLVAFASDEGYKVVVPEGEEITVEKLWNPKLDGKRALYNPCWKKFDPWTNYAVAAGPGFVGGYAIVLVYKQIYEKWKYNIEYNSISVEFCKAVLSGATRDWKTWIAVINVTDGSMNNFTIDWIDPFDHTVGALPVGVLVSDKATLSVLDDSGNITLNITLPEGLGSPMRVIPLTSGEFAAVLYQFGFTIVSLVDGRVFTHVFDQAPYSTYYVVEAAWNFDYGNPDFKWYVLALLTRDSLYIFDTKMWSLQKLYTTTLDNSGLIQTSRLAWVSTHTIAALLGDPNDKTMVVVFKNTSGVFTEVPLNPPPDQLQGMPAGIAAKGTTLIVFLGDYDPGSFTMKISSVAGYNMYTDPGKLVYHAVLPRVYDGVVTSRYFVPAIYMWDENYFVVYHTSWIDYMKPDDENEYFNYVKPAATAYKWGAAFTSSEEKTLTYDDTTINVTVVLGSASILYDEESALVEGIGVRVIIEVTEANGETIMINIRIKTNTSIIQEVYNGKVNGPGYIYTARIDTDGAANITLILPDAKSGNKTDAWIILGPKPGYYDPPPVKDEYYEINVSMSTLTTPPTPPVQEITTTTTQETTTPPVIVSSTTTTGTITPTTKTTTTWQPTTTHGEPSETAIRQAEATTEATDEGGDTGANVILVVAAVILVLAAAAYIFMRR